MVASQSWKSVKHIWRDAGAGLVVPDGIVSDRSSSQSQTYLNIKEKALAVEELYSRSKVTLPPTCDLARLIANAKNLSDDWLLGQDTHLTMDALLSTAHLNRIADAVLPLKQVIHKAVYLKALTAQSLRLHERTKSHAKNILWELELWSILRGRSFDATLVDPPDIVVALGSSIIGIACKKIYSEGHVQNVLSEAVSQVESSFDCGIVAVNIDDLSPDITVPYRFPNHEMMGSIISDMNSRFIDSHDRHFRKYLGSGRLIAALVSTGVVADVYGAETRFNNARQSTVWTIPGLPRDKERLLAQFRDQLMG